MNLTLNETMKIAEISNENISVIFLFSETTSVQIMGISTFNLTLSSDTDSQTARYLVINCIPNQAFPQEADCPTHNLVYGESFECNCTGKIGRGTCLSGGLVTVIENLTCPIAKVTAGPPPPTFSHERQITVGEYYSEPWENYSIANYSSDSINITFSDGKLEIKCEEGIYTYDIASERGEETLRIYCEYCPDIEESEKNRYNDTVVTENFNYTCINEGVWHVVSRRIEKELQTEMLTSTEATPSLTSVRSTSRTGNSTETSSQTEAPKREESDINYIAGSAAGGAALLSIGAIGAALQRRRRNIA